MIHSVLILLRDLLNEYIKQQMPSEATQDRVVFIDGDKMDPVTFPPNAVAPLLINLEEEGATRDANPYIQRTPDGKTYRAYPELRLNLYVLFAAHFTAYEEALKHLSVVISFFQNNRVLTPDEFPTMPPELEKLVLEVVTMPFDKQNEIWNALRTTYLPSVLYKVRMIVFADDTPNTVTGASEMEANPQQN